VCVRIVRAVAVLTGPLQGRAGRSTGGARSWPLSLTTLNEHAGPRSGPNAHACYRRLRTASLSNHTIGALHAAVLPGAAVALSRAGKPRVPRPDAVLAIGNHHERTVAGSARGTAADLRCCGDHRPLRVDGVHVHGVMMPQGLDQPGVRGHCSHEWPPLCSDGVRPDSQICNQLHSPPHLKWCKSLPVYRLASSAAATACDEPDVCQSALNIDPRSAFNRDPTHYRITT
jgi:hypothetical protein